MAYHPHPPSKLIHTTTSPKSVNLIFNILNRRIKFVIKIAMNPTVVEAVKHENPYSKSINTHFVKTFQWFPTDDDEIGI